MKLFGWLLKVICQVSLSHKLRSCPCPQDHRSKIANSDKIPMKVRSIYTVGQALLCPLRIGEKHPRNGGVSAPLTSGACGCLSQCLYPARGINMWSIRNGIVHIDP